MRHEEALALLPEFLQGGLAEPTRSAVASHRAACDECRALSDAYVVIAASLRHSGPAPAARASADGVHPASALIVAYAVDPAGLDPGESSVIATHLAACSRCSEEVETTRQAHQATRPTVVPFPGNLLGAATGVGRPDLRAAIAVAAVLVVLAYPAYLGLGRLPRLREEAGELRAAQGAAEREIEELKSSLDDARERLRRESAWTGPVELHVLEGPARGAGGLSPLRVAKDQPFLLLSVLPPVPAGVPDRAPLRFAIFASDDRVVWSADLAISETRRRLKSSGVLTFMIPAATLPPGRYTMRIFRPGEPQGRTIFQAPFEVVVSD